MPAPTYLLGQLTYPKGLAKQEERRLYVLPMSYDIEITDHSSVLRRQTKAKLIKKLARDQII